MGPMERKERERLALRGKILDAARRLFAEQGYEAVTMRTIAQAVEYSPRTLYLHFRDKEELIRELCDADFRALGQGFAQLMGIPDPLDRLRALGRGYASFAQAHPHHYRLMFMTPMEGVEGACAPDRADPEADAYAFLLQCLEEALAKGLLKPQWTDAQLLAQITWGAIHGVLALEVTHGSRPFVPWRDLEARIEAVLDLIQAGLRA